MADTKYLISGKSDPGASASYDTGTALAAGDTVYWADGGSDVSSNLGQSGKDILSLTLAPTWSGNVAAESGAFEIVIDQTGTGFLDIQGAGRLFSFSGGGAANVINEVRHRPVAGGRLVLTSCTNAKFCIEAGSAAVRSTVILGDVDVRGGDLLLEQHASDLIANLRAFGGRVNLQRDWTAAYVGGDCRATIDLTLPAAVAGGTLDQTGGEILLVNGPLATYNGYQGVLDATRLKTNVTWATGNLYPGLIIRKNRTGPQLTITTTNLKYGGPKYEYVG